jgi:hypothetical protein
LLTPAFGYLLLLDACLCINLRDYEGVPHGVRLGDLATLFGRSNKSLRTQMAFSAYSLVPRGSKQNPENTHSRSNRSSPENTARCPCALERFASRQRMSWNSDNRGAIPLTRKALALNLIRSGHVAG